MEKLHAWSSEQKEKKGSGVEMECNIVLRERNKALSEQLQKSIDGYRSLKRRLRDIQEENRQIRDTVEQMEEEVDAGIHRIGSFKEGRMRTNEIKEEISALEHMLDSLKMKVSKYTQKKT